INSITAANGSQIYIGNIPLGNLVGAGRPILDMGDTDITINGVLGVHFRFEVHSLLRLFGFQNLFDRKIAGGVRNKIELLTTTGDFTIPDVIRKPIIMDISFEVDSTNKKIYMTYNGFDFTNVGTLPNAPEDVSKFAEYLQRLLEAEEMVGLSAGYSLLGSLITIDNLGDYIARLEEALGTVNYDSLLSDLSEISGVSGFVDDFTSANCAVRDRSYQSLVVRHEESGCSWTSFKEQSIGGRDEQAITSGRQAPLGEHWVSMVAGQYKKVELVDRVEGHARDSETYLLGAGLRSRAPIANVAEVSVSLTMGRGEHRRNREWASVQQASMPEMNFQMVRIGASRSFALPLKGSWRITPSTDFNLVRVDVSDLQHEGSAGDRVFAVDDMEHNRQSVRVGLEVRGEREGERGASITAFARVGVEHYVNGRSAGYSIRLVGASEGFTYYGRAIDENVLTASFGITRSRGKAVSFRAFYEGKQGVGGIYENHEAKLELLRRF
ncbi:MAG: autotransporter outer membrane beta-barrel domain-containing protein, partial [Parvibaculales bacterium]